MNRQVLILIGVLLLAVIGVNGFFIFRNGKEKLRQETYKQAVTDILDEIAEGSKTNPVEIKREGGEIIVLYSEEFLKAQ